VETWPVVLASPEISLFAQDARSQGVFIYAIWRKIWVFIEGTSSIPR
jgi:hypothetical protein